MTALYAYYYYNYNQQLSPGTGKVFIGALIVLTFAWLISLGITLVKYLRQKPTRFNPKQSFIDMRDYPSEFLVFDFGMIFILGLFILFYLGNIVSKFI
jgi:hypothetical protein